MQIDLFGNIIKDFNAWDRLTEDEKEEILKKAKERKQVERKEMAKKIHDSYTGRQKSIESAWES